MMDRRSFLRRASLIAAGVVAADQIELLEMLAPRRLFPSIALRGNTISNGWTKADVSKLWRKVQGEAVEAIHFEVAEIDWLQSDSIYLPGSRRLPASRLLESFRRPALS